MSTDSDYGLEGLLAGVQQMTLNVSEGIGGIGGVGGLAGGLGGSGEGARIYVMNAERWTVHMAGSNDTVPAASMTALCETELSMEIQASKVLVEEDKPEVKPCLVSSSSDPLARISGHIPKVLLVDGEERLIKSSSSATQYKIKRTSDHYYCQCPAWRNQLGAPANARTCKHLRELWGEKYEAARLEWKLAGGSALKPASKPKPGPKEKGKKQKPKST